MFVFHAVRTLCSGFAHPLNVLDACAAPGGKSTAAIDALPPGSHITANEFDPRRANALIENVVRHGSGHISVTTGPAQRFAKQPETFDLIIADCPCSGEGMMRKEPKAVQQWSPELVQSCATVQREIVDALYAALKPGGIMLYSTCTFNEVENEQIISHLLSTTDAQNIPIPEISPDWGIQPAKDGITGYRFHPDFTLGEGLFMAAIAKPGVWIPSKLSFSPFTPDFKGEKCLPGLPNHSQLMLSSFDITRFQTCEIDRDKAVAYLRGNAITIDAPKGPVVLTYENLPLGWVKNLGSRANNLYPPSLRIRSTY